MTLATKHRQGTSLDQYNDDIWDAEYIPGTAMAIAAERRRPLLDRRTAIFHSLIRIHPESAPTLLELQETNSELEDILVDGVAEYCFDNPRNNA